MIDQFTDEELDYLYELLHRDIIFSKYQKKNGLDINSKQKLKKKFDLVWKTQTFESAKNDLCV